MPIRINNVFILNQHILRFTTSWRNEAAYLDVEACPRPMEGHYRDTDWAYLHSISIPVDFDYDQFLDAFWREARQGRPIDLANIVSEIIREQTRELMEV